MHMGQSYSLKNWGAVLLRGTDEFHFNRLATLARSDGQSLVAKSNG